MPVSLRETSKAINAAVAPAVADVRPRNKPGVLARPRDSRCRKDDRHSTGALSEPPEIRAGPTIGDGESSRDGCNFIESRT